MANAILVIAIVLVLALFGFFLSRGLGEPEVQSVQSTPASGRSASSPLVPIAAAPQIPPSPVVEKVYHETIAIESKSFFFSPDTIRVKRGKKVTVNIHSFGDHTFTIDALGVSVKTPHNKVTKVEFTPQKAGAYQYYCKLPGHKEAGQIGILIVE